MLSTDTPHTLNRDESLYRLQENTDAQCEKENAVEEGTEKSRALPAKGKILWRVFFRRDLLFVRGKPQRLWNAFLTFKAANATINPIKSFSWKGLVNGKFQQDKEDCT